MSYKDVIGKDMEKVWEMLSNAINNFNDTTNAEAFFNQLTRQHRTLQQSFWRMMIFTIKEYAKLRESGWYDLRNEESVKMCEGLAQWLEDNYYTTLPTV